MPIQVHPTQERHPSLPKFLWRYFTGLHLDGIPRTNATWFQKGTAPSHHANWWTCKPRYQRMIWRWGMVLVPTGWLIAYHFSPVYGINLTLIVTIAIMPYLVHHGVYKILRMIPRSHVVFVHDNVIAEDVNPEIDDVSIGEQYEGDDIQAILDISVDDIDRIPTDDKRRNRRSS